MALTPKQHAFANALLSGLANSNAYRSAYPDSKGNKGTIARKAHALSTHPEVSAYIAQERAKTAQAFSWSREEMLETLKDIASKADSPADRTRAIAQASKMLGFDAPVKTEQSGALTIKWET